MSNGTIGWDLDAGGGGGDKAEFTKFPVGTTRIRILDPAPHIRWTHWMNQFRRSVNCPGMRECPIDDIIDKQKANGEKPTYARGRRYAMNVWNYDTNRAEIMEQGKTFFEDLNMIRQDLDEEKKALSDVVLRVRRTGTDAENTKYRIDVQGDAEEPLHTNTVDLMEYFKPHTVEQITRLLNGEAWDDVMTSQTADEHGGNDTDEEIQVN